MAGRFEILEEAPSPDEADPAKVARPGGRFEIIPEKHTLPTMDIGHPFQRVEAEAKKIEEMPAAVRYPLAAAAGAINAVPGSTDARAALTTGLTYLGAKPPDVKTTGPFAERFTSARRKQADFNQAIERSYPKTALAGQVAGTFALPLAGPASRVASVLEPVVGGGVARAAGMGTVGALYGGASGFGEGENLDERISNAKRGAIIGGGGGLAVPAVVDMTGAGANKLVNFLALRSPASEASKTFSGGMAAAGRLGGGMSPAEALEGITARQPVLPIDLGGATIRQAAKTATHANPEAKDILFGELEKRGQEQQSRLYDYLEGLVGKNLSDPNVAEQIRAAARAVNTPAYDAAMTKGAGGVWNNTLERITNHPWIKQAIPQAVDEANANAIAKGLPPIENPFVTDAAGKVALKVDSSGNPIKPPLEMWDIIKKNLDGRIRAAEATPTNRGDPNTVRLGKSIVGALTKELKGAIPEYATALTGAGRYLGEEDAHRFGAKFLSMTKAADINASIQRLSKFTPEELEYAQHSYMAERAQKFMNASKNRDVGKMTFSPTQKAKDVAILGQKKADQLEAYLLRESVMQKSLASLGGSDTVPNVIAAMHHLAGTTGSGLVRGAMTGAGEAFWEGGLDPKDIGYRISAGAIAGALLGHRVVKSQKAAVELANKLVSQDPAVWKQAVNAISNAPKGLAALRRVEAMIPAIGVNRRELPAPPERKALPPPAPAKDRAARATGGSVLHGKKTAQSLIRAVEQAKKAVQQQTETILSQPDEHVVKALSVASKHL